MAHIVLASVVLLSLRIAWAEPVPVRYPEGVMHGFLELQTQEGKNIAWGEMAQVARGHRVTSHLTFSFSDGSIYDETTIFTQQGTFRLVNDRKIQKGPAFKQSTDTTVDASKGEVTVRYTDKDGSEKVQTQHMELPPDVVNGLIFSVVKDIPGNTSDTTLSMVAASPKPRIVKLRISSQGVDPFSVGNLQRKATHYVVKIEIKGVAGVVAPLVGKQPSDLHVWVAEGGVPGFIKFEGPLEEDGPIWRIQMAPPPVFKAAVGQTFRPLLVQWHRLQPVKVATTSAGPWRPSAHRC